MPPRPPPWAGRRARVGSAGKASIGDWRRVTKKERPKKTSIKRTDPPHVTCVSGVVLDQHLQDKCMFLPHVPSHMCRLSCRCVPSETSSLLRLDSLDLPKPKTCLVTRSPRSPHPIRTSDPGPAEGGGPGPALDGLHQWQGVGLQA